ncbi:MAG: zinc ABC transporter substrate-binding protein [Fibrobacter sp.]|nr:zinc ABC transporter substrate-binding protein [Fibrobacter sp.]
MKKFAFFATLFFMAAFMLAGCKTESGEKATSKKISVVVTIYPQYDWLKNILGERFDAVNLKLLIKNGTDLHSYKPSAQDIASIAGADMVVFVGGESDEWIKKALAATPKEGRITVNLMEALGDRVKEEEVVEGMQVEEETRDERHGSAGSPTETREEEHHHEHHHEHAEEAENDEHIWLSLKNAVILVNALAEPLAKLDSANAASYKMNAAVYAAKLYNLDGAFTATVAGASQKTILFGDRFPFRYMVDDYGIKYFAAFVGCSAESEASFETVTFLAGKMDSLSLPAIFTIEGGNGKIARTILEASKKSKNAEILTLNSMQSVTDAQMKDGLDYLSIMQSNLDVLKKALK